MLLFCLFIFRFVFVLRGRVSRPEATQALGISEYTVKAHVRALLQKTGLSSRTELAIEARVVGLALKTEQ